MQINNTGNAWSDYQTNAIVWSVMPTSWSENRDNSFVALNPYPAH
jgi:hypothetical protein